MRAALVAGVVIVGGVAVTGALVHYAERRLTQRLKLLETLLRADLEQDLIDVTPMIDDLIVCEIDARVRNEMQDPTRGNDT